MPSNYRQLRGGFDLLRDCWLDQDDTDHRKQVLVVRQVRMRKDAETAEIKQMRFTLEEMLLLADLIDVARMIVKDTDDALRTGANPVNIVQK